MTSRRLIPCTAEGCDDGYVYEFRRCRSGSAEEPMLATGERYPCEVCDGTGVVLEERREQWPDQRALIDSLNEEHRAQILRLIREDERAYDEVATERDRYKRAALSVADTNERLIAQNRELRDRLVTMERALAKERQTTAQQRRLLGGQRSEGRVH